MFPPITISHSFALAFYYLRAIKRQLGLTISGIHSNALTEAQRDATGTDSDAKVRGGLKLCEMPLLLKNDYLPLESGWCMTSENLAMVAASTYMEGATADMWDWWFGFIETTEQYKWWHERDHVYSAWEGPRNNDANYIGGHHLVHEYIGGELCKLKISFKDPSEYFGPSWKNDFENHGYGTAICGRVGDWDPATNKVKYMGHLLHLVKNEPGGCRMRSRFWLGDIEGVGKMGHLVPATLRDGLCKHATEEMSILGRKLPALYQKYSQVKQPRG